MHVKDAALADEWLASMAGGEPIQHKAGIRAHSRTTKAIRGIQEKARSLFPQARTGAAFSTSLGGKRPPPAPKRRARVAGTSSPISDCRGPTAAARAGGKGRDGGARGDGTTAGRGTGEDDTSRGRGDEGNHVSPRRRGGVSNAHFRDAGALGRARCDLSGYVSGAKGAMGTKAPAQGADLLRRVAAKTARPPGSLTTSQRLAGIVGAAVVQEKEWKLAMEAVADPIAIHAVLAGYPNIDAVDNKVQAELKRRFHVTTELAQHFQSSFAQSLTHWVEHQATNSMR